MKRNHNGGKAQKHDGCWCLSCAPVELVNSTHFSQVSPRGFAREEDGSSGVFSQCERSWSVFVGLHVEIKSSVRGRSAALAVDVACCLMKYKYNLMLSYINNFPLTYFQEYTGIIWTRLHHKWTGLWRQGHSGKMEPLSSADSCCPFASEQEILVHQWIDYQHFFK